MHSRRNLQHIFGEHLPSDVSFFFCFILPIVIFFYFFVKFIIFLYQVVDELCNLVQDNSYGKCHYCGLPAESLVLSVLQILHDASQNLGRKTHGSQVAHSSHACRNAPVCNNHDANFNSMNKKAPPASGMYRNFMLNMLCNYAFFLLDFGLLSLISILAFFLFLNVFRHSS